MRLIYDPSHVQQPLAILRMDIAADRVDAAVSRSTITQNGTVLLLERQRGAHRLLLRAGGSSSAALCRRPPPEWRGRQDTSQGPFRVQSMVLEDCGWTLAAALPRDDIFRTSRELRWRCWRWWFCWRRRPISWPIGSASPSRGGSTA